MDRVQFADAKGRRWVAYEHNVSNGDPPMAERTLVFISDMAVRRVRQYPADWAELSPDKLEQLSWGT